ncbi:MAG: RNA methyltransferase [Rhodospirillales bacterium]
MAGTDSSRAPDGEGADTAAPAVILAEPQLGENIGMCARAMLNGGLSDLRIVNPRDGWPNEKALAAASGADTVINAARVFETVEAAVADLNRLYACTARERDAALRVMTPRAAAADMQAACGAGHKAGVLFGRESKGLKNDEVSLADAVIHAPLNPAFRSLNIAQAVLIVAYEWRLAGPGADAPADMLVMPAATRPARRDEMQGLFGHLESELDACGFLRVKEKRPTMVRNIRNMFNRAHLTEQEVRTLRGVIKGLTDYSGGKGKGGE